MSQRIKWIDMAKGYGTILVIIGHLVEGPLKNEIYSFHMPLFFFLAGYVFLPRKYGAKEFLKKKIQTLIVPYFFMGTVISTCMWIFHGEFTIEDLVECFSGLIIQRRFQAIWFLACLFLTEVIMYFTIHVVKENKGMLFLISSIMVALGFVYYELVNVSLPWNIDICTIAIFYFTIGYLVRQIQFFERSRFFQSKIGIIFLGLILQMFCVKINFMVSNERVDMFYNQYGCIPITLIASVMGILGIVYISNIWSNKIVTYIGSHSLVYFGWHNALIIPIMDIIYKYLGIFQDKESNLHYTLYIIITTIMVLISLSFIDFVIRKTRFRVLLGSK